MSQDHLDSGLEMFTSPWTWITDMFYAGIQLLGWFTLIALIGLAAGYALTKAGLL